MIVPQYWTESTAKKKVDGRSFTIKRFGWSDSSEQDAKRHADERLQEAVRILERDKDVRRVDHKTSYNGSEGIPIREEVIERHDDVVISRNSYGALCLNTPDVLFADVDFNDQPSRNVKWISFGLLCLITLLLCIYFKSLWLLFIGLFVGAILQPILALLLHKATLVIYGSVEQRALARIEKVCGADPQLNFRVYRTPMGYRLLAMHATYDPASDETIALLNALKSDRVYIQMCKNQRCFRARVSPKPWRMGLSRIKPQPGIWPINEARLADRAAWVRDYEKKATNYAACHYLMQLGSQRVSAKADAVRILHDALCRSDKVALKLA